MLTVYVPKPNSPLRTQIVPGSGIVGDGDEGTETVVIDYEGNQYDAVNLKRYADRIHQAAGRHQHGERGYPTTARDRAERDELIAVGTFDPETGEVSLTDEHEDTVVEWLDLGPETTRVPRKELQASSARFRASRS